MSKRYEGIPVKSREAPDPTLFLGFHWWWFPVFLLFVLTQIWFVFALLVGVLLVSNMMIKKNSTFNELVMSCRLRMGGGGLAVSARRRIRQR